MIKFYYVEQQYNITFSIWFVKRPAPSWSTYEAGQKGCSGEGEGLLDSSKQYLVLKECQISCHNTSSCNAIAWNSRDNRCFLKRKSDACNDVPCDWGRSDAIEWSFYRKSCGNQRCSQFCTAIYSNLRFID